MISLFGNISLKLQIISYKNIVKKPTKTGTEQEVNGLLI